MTRFFQMAMVLIASIITTKAFALDPTYTALFSSDAIKGYEWGINNSPETKNDEFTHAFMVTFDSEDGRKAYLPHPEHEAFVDVLLPVLDKVRVLVFWAEK